MLRRMIVKLRGVSEDLKGYMEPQGSMFHIKKGRGERNLGSDKHICSLPHKHTQIFNTTAVVLDRQTYSTVE